MIKKWIFRHYLTDGCPRELGVVDEPGNFLGNAIGHRLHRGSTKSKVRWKWVKSHSPVMICGNSKACYQASAWQHRKSKNPIQTFDSRFWLLESAENGGLSTVHFVPVRLTVLRRTKSSLRGIVGVEWKMEEQFWDSKAGKSSWILYQGHIDI